MLGSILLAAAAAGAVPPRPPIRLVAEPVGEQVQIQLIGDSDTAVAASYELEASGGGGNRSVQRGTAELRPGQKVVLVRLTMGGGSDWSARLRVQTPTGNYEQQAQRPQ